MLKISYSEIKNIIISTVIDDEFNDTRLMSQLELAAARVYDEIKDICKTNENIQNTSTAHFNKGDNNTGNFNCGDSNRGNYNNGDSNLGKDNTGDYNHGDHNAGARNIGSNNIGNRNVGDYNTGKCNNGDRNIGTINDGNYNVGDSNIGNNNTGNDNNGDSNSGSSNIGTGNIGNHNVGIYNVGDWNCGNYLIGCFNTIQQKMMMFNKPTEWTFNDWNQSHEREILANIPHIGKKYKLWIDAMSMSDNMKVAYPNWKTLGGCMATVISNVTPQLYWNNMLNHEEKQLIVNLPNFDKDIFEDCTGIDIEKDPNSTLYINTNE